MMLLNIDIFVIVKVNSCFTS